MNFQQILYVNLLNTQEHGLHWKSLDVIRKRQATKSHREMFTENSLFN